MNYMLEINKLKDEHSVNIHYSKLPSHGMVDTLTREIHLNINTTDSQILYWVALHEVAHIKFEHRANDGNNNREIEAWQWAIDNSKEKICGKIEKLITNCLKSYGLGVHLLQQAEVYPRSDKA